MILNTTSFAGVALWSLALYLGFSPVGDRLTTQLHHWFDGGRSPKSPDAAPTLSSAPIPRDSTAHLTLWASLLSVLPFLGIGGLINYGVEVGLGHSWAISMGLIACIGCGVYELGRRDGQASG